MRLSTATALIATAIFATGTARAAAATSSTPPPSPNTADCWLLDSPLFERLSGGKQNFLIRECNVKQFDYEKKPVLFPPKPFNSNPNESAAVTNLQVNGPDTVNSNQTTQSETSVAVNGNFVVALWNDDGGGSFNTDYAFSSDGGTTWTDTEPLKFPTVPGACCDGDVDSFSPGSSVGHFGAIWLASGIWFTKSADGGATWGSQVQISTGGSPDKSFMAIDNNAASSSKDTIFAGWTDFGVGSGAITVKRSIDGGATWVNQTQLTTGSTSIQAVDLAPAGNGIWYAAWLDFEGSFPGTTRHIDVRKSSDNGVTWAPLVTAVPSFPRAANAPLCSGRPSIAGGPQRIQEGPHIVVNPVNKHVYLTTEQHGAGTDECDVVFARSIDGGATWFVNSKVNDDLSGRGNSFSTITVTPDGTQVIIGAYDKRLALDDLHEDRFVYRSLDEGATWPIQDRVSTVTTAFAPTNPNFDSIVAACYHGDYDRIAADNTAVYSIWGDDRNIKIAPGFASGRPDPDVFFNKLALITGPALSIGDASVIEGNVGSVNMVFPVTLSPTTPSTVTVNFATSDGSAVAGLDYTNTSGILTIPANSGSGQILVPVTGDTIPEGDETFTVTLSSPINASIADGTATGTILDDEPPLLSDDFGDGIQSWTVTGDAGGYTESGGNLVGTAQNTNSALAPLPWSPSGLSTCTICTVEAGMKSAGGAGSQVVLMGWYQSNNNLVALIMNEPGDTWGLRQRIGGVWVASQSANLPISPGTNYAVKVSFDGTNFTASVNGTPIITLAAAATPFGNFGFRVTKTTGTFDGILVY